MGQLTLLEEMDCHWVVATFYLSVLKRKLDICISFSYLYLLGKDLFSFTT